MISLQEWKKKVQGNIQEFTEKRKVTKDYTEYMRLCDLIETNRDSLKLIREYEQLSELKTLKP